MLLSATKCIFCTAVEIDINCRNATSRVNAIISEFCQPLSSYAVSLVIFNCRRQKVTGNFGEFPGCDSLQISARVLGVLLLVLVSISSARHLQRLHVTVLHQLSMFHCFFFSNFASYLNSLSLARLSLLKGA